VAREIEFELRTSAGGALAGHFERERKDVTDERGARGRNLHTRRTGLEQLPVVGCASESGTALGETNQ
jgi:hypothetical protein